ncbi:MAG: hypothetical protein QOG54_2350 [Actinomycetota bacterium]|nr:hypothetical protein [Actinomycetota bacterium]
MESPDALELLATGEVEVLGLLPYASNYTFLARVGSGSTKLHAVYKPQRGERPLWDFPPGTLAAREVAAFVASDEGGWNIVPPTVLRGDAPLGSGSLQLFVEHDPERHYFVLVEERRDDMAAFAAFDAVVNNADRKAGHVLEGRDGKLWAVDHGVTFNLEPKLRTVIWEFAEEPLPDAIRSRLQGMQPALEPGGRTYETLASLLSPEEAEATADRVRSLLSDGYFPAPTSERPLPWPLI